MKLTLLPAEERFILAEHHEWVTVGEGEDARLEKGAPIHNAPVWRFRPLTKREEARWRGRYDAVRNDPAAQAEVSCELFETQLIGVGPLEVEMPDGTVEPFDKDRHLATARIPYDWQDEFAGMLLAGARLSVEQLGK